MWKSCLFASVVLHAYSVRAAGYHFIFLFLILTQSFSPAGLLQRLLLNSALIFVASDIQKVALAEARWLPPLVCVAECCMLGQYLVPSAKGLHTCFFVTLIASPHYLLLLVY